MVAVIPKGYDGRWPFNGGFSARQLQPKNKSRQAQLMVMDHHGGWHKDRPKSGCAYCYAPGPRGDHAPCASGHVTPPRAPEPICPDCYPGEIDR